jgi:uncharacterized protein YkwD
MLLMKGTAVAVVVLMLADGTVPTKPKQAASQPTKTKAVAFTLHPAEAKVIEQTNAQRAQHGLPPLVVDQRLVRSARAHTAWMTRARRLQHTSMPLAENIAMGQPTAWEAVRSWMSSAGHRANILNPNYRRIGVSGYTAPDGTTYWTQQFQP